MNQIFHSIITGTGSYVPSRKVSNEDFIHHDFFDFEGVKLKNTNREIIDKFQEITTIDERRYVTGDLVTSDIAFYAAAEAITTAGIDKENLDYIIVAHNFGDIKANTNRTDIVPCLAARVKHKLAIQNPKTVAYDLPFGCPGWLQAMIQADYYIRSGDAKKILIIGAEVLSRVSDPHDRDSLIYADGAGAAVLEARECPEPIGILAHNTRSDTLLYANMLFMGKSNNPDFNPKDNLFLKMNGRKLYQYALETVPLAIKECLEKCSISLSSIKKILIHQANGKMDDAILKRLFGLFGLKEVLANIMPMSISWLGNSSVATLPTLLDLILKGKLPSHCIDSGDTIVFASVGAGMNINSMVYKMA
ncbi:MAG TPA: ketoacyl-ACP synthase III [Bacteroidales bacterium]|nr:ketoacyl-ACP synthase III [Bacteroidales bacterium]HQI71123.1 ketoacyl-ACP synthase III [Bacteroidales bacterium]